MLNKRKARRQTPRHRRFLESFEEVWLFINSTHCFCLIHILRHPSRSQSGSFDLRTDSALLPVTRSKLQQTDLLPPHRSKVKRSKRTFQQWEHVHKIQSKASSNISDTMTQWCDRMQQSHFNHLHDSLNPSNKLSGAAVLTDKVIF